MGTWVKFLKVSLLHTGFLITLSSSLNAQSPQDPEAAARQKAANCGLDYDILMDNIARHMPGRGPAFTGGEDVWKDYEFPLTIHKNNQECFTYLPSNPNYKDRSYTQDKVTPMWSATKSMSALATGMVMYRIDTYIDELIAQDALRADYQITAIDEQTYEITTASGSSIIRRFTLNQTIFNWIQWSQSEESLFANQPVHRGASVRQLLAMVAGREKDETEVTEPGQLNPKFEYDMTGQRGLNQVGFMADSALKQFQNPLLPVPTHSKPIEPGLDQFWLEQIKPGLGFSSDAQWGIANGPEGIEEFWNTYVVGFSPLLSRVAIREQTAGLPPDSGDFTRELSFKALDELTEWLGVVPRIVPEKVKVSLANRFGGTKFYGFSWEASLQDMAKIGQVIVDQGIAYKGLPNEKRMVSRSFIHEMTHSTFPQANSAMGLAVWVNTPDKDNRIIVWQDDRKLQDKPAYYQADNSLLSCAPVERNSSELTGSTLDTGIWTFAGAFGQVVMGHPALGLVVAYKDASMDASRVIDLNWEKIIVPALMAKNSEFKSIEDFCSAYGSNQYAPYLTR